MAIPADAKIWPDAMDPKDLIEYIIPLAGFLLEPGELVDTFDLDLLSASALAGLIIRQDAGRAPSYVNGGILLWLSVDPAEHGNAIFDGSGIQAGMELFFRTNSAPYRERQITAVVKIKNN
jgi:hypothetical protein